jgi:ATP-binding cassette, subfamily C, bacterial CydD
VKEFQTSKEVSSMHIRRRLIQLAKDVNGFLPGIALLSFLITIVVIFQMYFLSLIIAEVFMTQEFNSQQWLYLLLLCIILRSLLLWIRERFAQQQAVKIKSSMRQGLLNHILNLGIAYTHTGKTGAIIASVSEGVEKLDDYFTRYIPSVIHIIILPAVIVAFTLYFDWPSGLIMLITAPLILFFMWMIGTHAKKLTENQWHAMSRLSSHFLDVLQGLKTLKIFGMSKRESGHVYESSNRFRIVTMEVLKVAFLSGMVLELAASISIAMVAVQVGIRLIEGMMVFQTGLFVLLLAPEFYLPFRTLGLHHHAGMEGSAVASEIFNITDKNNGNYARGHRPFSSGKEISIVCDNIHYTYPETQQHVLKGLHCHLQPGTLTAVVGPTGTGKTTFAHILLGYLQADRGRLLINNMSLNDMDMEQWQQNVAYVPQHPHFFNGSLLDNLLMANPAASTQQIEDAAMEAGAHHFISQLPNGYHTILTDNAERLSGGEKQMLAITRALLKNAPLLILDEPTSNLDPESEQLVAEATTRIVKGRTTLVIAHRLKTVINAHNILVFSNGVVAESGKHSELIRQNGIYAGYLSSLGKDTLRKQP